MERSTVDRARAHPRQQAAVAERDRLHLRRARQRGEHHLAGLRHLARRGGPARARVQVRLGGLRAQVVHDERVAGLLHVERHAGAHDAQPDESHVHGSLPHLTRSASSAFQSNSTPCPGRSGRDGEAVLDPQRIRDNAVEAEAVRLEVGAVRRRGQQVHGDVVGAVRGHRQVERLGEVADLHEDRHAAAVGHVGLRERHAAGGDQLPELVQRVEVLAGGHRQPALAHDAHVAGHVVGDRRLLQPHRVRRRQGRAARIASSTLQRMLASTISGNSGPRCSPHRPHALDVLAQRRAPHLHLDGAKAAREVVVGLAQQRVQREVEVDAARVAGHARVEAAEHAPERRAVTPRPQVPQRDVDGRDRQRLGAAAPAVVQRPPHRLPERLDALGVAAGEQRRRSRATSACTAAPPAPTV